MIQPATSSPADYLSDCEEADDESQMLTLQKKTESVQIGELLFPSFNIVIPQFVELLLPNAREARDVSSLVGVFYNMVRFSFKTQIYEKRLP